MNWKSQWKAMLLIAAAMAACWLMPVGQPRFDRAVNEALLLAKDYAQHKVLAGLLPGLFIGGAISVFLNRLAVLKYMGPSANKPLAYGVASVSGTVLSVCSCNILPLFAGIRKMGAGLGPAIAVLYAGPAVNVLALVMTWQVMGGPMTLARIAGAVGFSILIGLTMAALFGRREKADADAFAQAASATPAVRPLWKTALVLGAAILLLVFLNWSPAGFVGLLKCCDNGNSIRSVQALNVITNGASAVIEDRSGVTTEVPIDRLAALQPLHSSAFSAAIYDARYFLAAATAFAFLAMLLQWFSRDEINAWLMETWMLARKIFPLLLAGVLASGFLLGRPGSEGLIPSAWISAWLSGNSAGANLLASVFGALMYFATLTEIPIVQGLMNSGMGHGPALAMLLSGPSVSLPSILVLLSILGLRKTSVYVSLVVLLAAAAGMIYGAFH